MLSVKNRLMNIFCQSRERIFVHRKCHFYLRINSSCVVSWFSLTIFHTCSSEVSVADRTEHHSLYRDIQKQIRKCHARSSLSQEDNCIQIYNVPYIDGVSECHRTYGCRDYHILTTLGFSHMFWLKNNKSKNNTKGKNGHMISITFQNSLVCPPIASQIVTVKLMNVASNSLSALRRIAELVPFALVGIESDQNTKK